MTSAAKQDWFLIRSTDACNFQNFSDGDFNIDACSCFVASAVLTSQVLSHIITEHCTLYGPQILRSILAFGFATLYLITSYQNYQDRICPSLLFAVFAKRSTSHPLQEISPHYPHDAHFARCHRFWMLFASRLLDGRTCGRDDNYLGYHPEPEYTVLDFKNFFKIFNYHLGRSQPQADNVTARREFLGGRTVRYGTAILFALWRKGRRTGDTAERFAVALKGCD